MDKAQTDLKSEAPTAPQEERAARHLRMLARAADIHMEIREATRTEAVEVPQPGVDYCARIAVITKSLRLTLLLEEKFAGQRDERLQRGRNDSPRRAHTRRRCDGLAFPAGDAGHELRAGRARNAEDGRQVSRSRRSLVRPRRESAAVVAKDTHPPATAGTDNEILIAIAIVVEPRDARPQL